MPRLWAATTDIRPMKVSEKKLNVAIVNSTRRMSGSTCATRNPATSRPTRRPSGGTSWPGMSTMRTATMAKRYVSALTKKTAAGPNTRVGPSWAKATRPTKLGDLVRVNANAVSTTFCIHVPTLESSAPVHTIRKLRWASAARTVPGANGTSPSRKASVASSGTCSCGRRKEGRAMSPSFLLVLERLQHLDARGAPCRPCGGEQHDDDGDGAVDADGADVESQWIAEPDDDGDDEMEGDVHADAADCPEHGADQADDAGFGHDHPRELRRPHSHGREEPELAPALHADEQQGRQHGDERDQQQPALEGPEGGELLADVAR